MQGTDDKGFNENLQIKVRMVV